MKVLCRFTLATSILVALILAMSCSKKEEAQDTDQDVKTAGLADPTDSLILEMAGVDSMTVFDVLESHHDVKHMSSMKGAYVTRIDGIKNEGGYFWMYSVNGVMGDVACDKYVTKTGDKVRWHYRQTGSLQL